MDVYDEYGLILLKASKENKRKISRKKTQLSLKLGESYPAAGHCAVTHPNQSQGEQTRRVLSFGGARRGADSSWTDSASCILEYNFEVDDEDVTLSSVILCKTKGGQMPPLQSPAVVESDGALFVWGGLNLVDYECHDDLIIIEEAGRRGAASAPLFDITYIQTEKNMVPSRRGNPVMTQTGTIPHARTGHTLTKLGETKQALLFGGIAYQEVRKSFNVVWEKSCRDGAFYILDLSSFAWRTVTVPSTKARAYHTAECLEMDGKLVVAFIGGVTFDQLGNVPSNREPINEILVLTMNSQLADHAVLSTVTLMPDVANTPKIFVSYHASAKMGEFIMVSGGFQQLHGSMQTPSTSPRASPRVFVLDMRRKKYKLLPKTGNEPQHTLFATAGHILIKLTPDCLVSLGGTSKQISLLSDRDFEPEQCDIAVCVIGESAESTEIQWVQCETPRCGKWFHTYCLKLTSIPEHYFCQQCTER
ncbi:uncharacterized protein [Diadema setosum]|uniref:uncharacterized protein n=1 Tax=Diadema setosum TaxID=31175 RepID=UPI003B3B2A1A